MTLHYTVDLLLIEDGVLDAKQEVGGMLKYIRNSSSKVSGMFRTTQVKAFLLAISGETALCFHQCINVTAM